MKDGERDDVDGAVRMEHGGVVTYIVYVRVYVYSYCVDIGVDIGVANIEFIFRTRNVCKSYVFRF